jgi:hypothetical protein
MEAEVQVGQHVKCQFSLSHFNPNWNISIKFSKTTEYRIRLKCVQRFRSCFMYGRRQGYYCAHCSLPWYVQIGSEANPMCTGGSFPGDVSFFVCSSTLKSIYWKG